jgi:hypothetical protein
VRVTQGKQADRNRPRAAGSRNAPVVVAQRGQAAGDVVVFLVSALLPLGFGLAVILGMLLLDGFGAFLGIIGGLFGLGWWHSQHKALVPRDASTKSVVVLAVVVAALLTLVLVLD